MKRIFLFLIAGISFGLGSCQKNTTTTTSHLTVRLTDAPGAYDAVLLNVKQIVVITSGGQATLNVLGGPVDILHFRLGKDTLLAGMDIPSGQIEQVRLILNNAGNRVIVNGTSHDLTTPSGQTSGVKINIHDKLTAGVDYKLLLDFDAAQSIVLTGNGKYILKPVIRAISAAVSGAIIGKVSPATTNASVYAINGIDTIGAVADTEGRFYFPGMAAGSYQIKFVPVNPYLVKTVSGVMVSNSSVSDMGTIIISN